MQPPLFTTVSLQDSLSNKTSYGQKTNDQEQNPAGRVALQAKSQSDSPNLEERSDPIIPLKLTIKTLLDYIK